MATVTMPLSRDDAVMRHIANAWACHYQPLSFRAGQFALTLPRQPQVVAFADVQVHSRPAKDFPDIPVSLAAYLNLAQLATGTRLPALIVAAFADSYLFAPQRAVQTPLDIRCLRGDPVVHLRLDQFAPIRYESRW